MNDPVAARHNRDMEQLFTDVEKKDCTTCPALSGEWCYDVDKNGFAIQRAVPHQGRFDA